jgi:hypothetical protein
MKLEAPSAQAPSHFRQMVRAAGIEPAWAYARRIFIPPRLSPPPRNPGRSWSGLSLRHGRRPDDPDFRRRPSSLYTFPKNARLASGARRAWLGIASLKGSPNLSGSTSGISPGALNPQLKSVASTDSATPAGRTASIASGGDEAKADGRATPPHRPDPDATKATCAISEQAHGVRKLTLLRDQPTEYINQQRRS